MKNILAAFLSLLIAVQANFAFAQSEKSFEEQVLEVIRKNPEIIREAITLLQEQEQLAAEQNRQLVIDENISLIQSVDNAPVLGNPDGDVTIVEFFDYNCSYCRQSAEVVEELLASDPNIRLIYREWPILGEGSIFAARASLAALKQNKYQEFHFALMRLTEPATEQSVLRSAKEVGLNIAQLQTDMDDPLIAEHVNLSREMTSALNFSGTPSFLIGRTAVPGYINLAQMRAVVESERTGSTTKE